MELHRSGIPGTNFIKFDETAGFWIQDELYTHSIIVTTETVITDWLVQWPGEIKYKDFELFATFDAEIFILGTGKSLVIPELRLIQPLIDQKCGYEIMNTRAACNTFNILSAEDRKTVAAILPHSF